MAYQSSSRHAKSSAVLAQCTGCRKREWVARFLVVVSLSVIGDVTMCSRSSGNPIQGTWSNTSDDAFQVSTRVHTLLGLTTAHPLIRQKLDHWSQMRGTKTCEWCCSPEYCPSIKGVAEIDGTANLPGECPLTIARQRTQKSMTISNSNHNCQIC